MTGYRSIKQLVIEETKKLNGAFPAMDKLEKLVKHHFPNSKWKETHYTWYKSQIKRGVIEIDTIGNNDSETFNENDTKEFSLSLESDLQSYLSSNLDEIEEGLELIENGIEYNTDAGFIDILATDKEGCLVVIELKAGKGKDSVVGQTLGYMGALSKEKIGLKIRGIIIASDFENRVIYAASSIENLKLVKYSLSFNFTAY